MTKKNRNLSILEIIYSFISKTADKCGLVFITKNRMPYKIPPVLREGEKKAARLFVMSGEKGRLSSADFFVANLRTEIGMFYKGIHIDYKTIEMFRRYPQHLLKILEKEESEIEVFFKEVCAWENCAELWNKITDNENVFCLCFDFAAAFSAANNKVPYIFIINNQQKKEIILRSNHSELWSKIYHCCIDRALKCYDSMILDKEKTSEKWLKNFIQDCGIEIQDKKSDINGKSLAEWKNKFSGKSVVICGTGSSIDGYRSEKGIYYIAINKALFYQNIKFDFHFMQDFPRNQPYTMQNYLSVDCTKFYGIITNPISKVLEINMDEYKNFEQKGRVIRYELMPRVFDYRFDQLTFDIETYCVADAQSTLFSAIQFAIYAGFKSIQLIGIDFSKKNYGQIKNPNSYADYVIPNLLRFKKEINTLYPERIFDFKKTTNKELKAQFRIIEKKKHENKKYENKEY